MHIYIHTYIHISLCIYIYWYGPKIKIWKKVPRSRRFCIFLCWDQTWGGGQCVLCYVYLYIYMGYKFLYVYIYTYGSKIKIWKKVPRSRRFCTFLCWDQTWGGGQKKSRGPCCTPKMGGPSIFILNYPCIHLSMRAHLILWCIYIVLYTYTYIALRVCVLFYAYLYIYTHIS